MRWKFPRRSKGCWRRASIGCRPTTSKPCNAPPSLIGFFKGACSPIYMNKERSIDLRLHSVSCNGANLFNRASSKRQKRLGWKKANTFSNMQSMLMESRFRPSQKCVDLARRAVTASDEANNPAQAGHVNFVLGLIELCHGDFGDAAEQCGRALAMAERTGDLVLQSRCLTYRAVAF